jgi:hypothetical protein
MLAPTATRATSLIPALGGKSFKAQFCRAGSTTWYAGTIVDLTDQALWAITQAPHLPGGVYLCYFQFGDREVHLALRRSRDALCFEVLDGATKSLGDALSLNIRTPA